MDEDKALYWLLFGTMVLSFIWGAIVGTFWMEDWGDIVIGALSFAFGSLAVRGYRYLRTAWKLRREMKDWETRFRG